MKIHNQKPPSAAPKDFVRKPNEWMRLTTLLGILLGLYSGTVMGSIEMLRLELYLAGEDNSLMWLFVWSCATIAVSAQIWVLKQAAGSWRRLHPQAASKPRWWRNVPFLSWFQIASFGFVFACCFGLILGTIEYLVQKPSLLPVSP